MNIVYMLINNTAFEAGEVAFLYVGSKVDCTVTDKTIIDKHGKEYWSCSKTVKLSIDRGDVWELFDFIEVEDRTKATSVEGAVQDSLCCAKSQHYYNLVHASANFNSMGDGVGDSIAKAKTGVVHPYMLKEDHWSQMHTPEARRKNSLSRIGNEKVIEAAKRRQARFMATEEGRARIAEVARRNFSGRKWSEHEIWLRKHDDRYKSGRVLSNEQVWTIRFGEHSALSLNELCDIYPVSKPTLSRVRNFKVFKDIKEDYIDE